MQGKAPIVRGFHWELYITRARPGIEAIELPPDDAPLGHRPPPLLRLGAERIGLDAGAAALAPHRAPRQEIPPVDSLAVELAGAKEYIASLEHALAERAAPPQVPQPAPRDNPLAAVRRRLKG